MPLENDLWKKMGPYSCLLNVDEVDNIDTTWENIAKLIDANVEDIKIQIAPLRDLYIVLDHTRTSMVIIYDGSLPSNVGGGSNVRNILRRVFAIMKKNGWWEKLKFEGFMRIFEEHKRDLEELYGTFPE